MASQFIEIDLSTRMGPIARQSTEELRNVLAKMTKIKDIADQAASGADWTSLEAVFGIPVGDGETFYNLLAGAIAAVDVSAVNQYIDRVG